ncbi:MAG TPA: alpha/beta fold hydrolase [Gemmatimonadales bacterium]
MPSPSERLAAFRRQRGRPPHREARTVRARGLDFAVWTTPEVAGAVPLVCINGGLLFDHASLWPTFAPLAEGRQLVFYDQRGRGKTQAPPGARAARIEHDAGDLGALREALGIERWDVLGHSWGGGIAMLGASLDLAGVRRVVTVDAVAPTSWWLARLHQIALERLRDPERAVLAALDPAALVEPDMATHASYARAFSPAWFHEIELAPLFTPPVSESVTGVAIASRLRREGYDWRERIRALDRPTLVIHGEHDALPIQAARELVALLPQARLAVIPLAGHMPFWERPETFFPLVESFLGGGEVS